MSSNEVIVSNVRPGLEPVIILCDVQVGDVKIHGVTLRKGRGVATYVNLPELHRHNVWSPLIEITAPDLLDAVRRAVVDAALEATRFKVPA